MVPYPICKSGISHNSILAVDHSDNPAIISGQGISKKEKVDYQGKNISYLDALEDFRRARRRARLEMVASWLSGKSSEMLQYAEVKRSVQLTESAAVHLEDIPLLAIVGSVSREADFSRQLLPLNESDNIRWAKVKQAFDSQEGVPPIEVFQVGETYFILDGHHRASVARQIGATHIQAYVRKVQSPVPLEPDDQIEDVVQKSEYAKFITRTRLDETHPETNFRCTSPDGYAKLLEHIEAHRYFMGIDQKREVSYQDAVLHWYEAVYSPVIRIVRRDDLLNEFPRNTEADLYLWIMDHRTDLEKKLNWKVDSFLAVQDFANHFGGRINRVSARFISKMVDTVLPDPLDVSPAPGVWRAQHAEMTRSAENPPQGIFQNILSTITGDDSGWSVLDYALHIANKEGSFVGGLFVTPKDAINADAPLEEFRKRCRIAAVPGELAVEQGNVTRLVYERSFWADLVVLRLSHPPPLFFFGRMGSGLRTLIRRCTTPLLVAPPSVQPELKKALLAYGGGPKADEALFLAAYLASRWNIELHVVTIDRKGLDGNKLIDRARLYLARHGVPDAYYHNSTGNPSQVILDQCCQIGCDLILMGGYEGGYFRELMLGSTVDRVLWKTRCPVLICH